MIAYRCLRCECIHGWGKHPAVALVKRHSRLPMEDIWRCPRCGQEHRSTDGTMFGQLHKRWEVVEESELDTAEREESEIMQEYGKGIL